MDREAWTLRDSHTIGVWLRRNYSVGVPADALVPVLRVWHLGLQCGRFGIVGAAATTFHAGAFAALIELAKLSPLIANIVAFGVALPLSFFGHLHWTFHPRDSDQAVLRSATRMMGKFIIVALLGVCLNSLAVYVVTAMLTLPYTYAIPLMVSVVPMTVFVLSKLWAFT
jgi:putative flippase GtrA